MSDDKIITISAKLEVKLPMIPNFLIVRDHLKLSVSEISKADLQKIGEAWTAELVKRGK